MLLVASPLFASGPTGTITGTITDPSGAVVPKARVVVRNEGTNTTRDAETNEDGDYTVALLPPGRYRVAVESAGFRRSVFHGVSLDVDQTVRLDFALQVGAITEEVTVSDTPPIVQTDTSTLGQVVNNRMVQELPLNERNFLSFALLAPGSQLPAQGSENSTEGGALSVNGAREQSNNFLLDGVDNNDPYINQYVALPSVDAIQQFKVQSSDYSAEFGHGGGAQVNVILKSGTNRFHGSLFEFFRNRHMDAKNYFDAPDCTANSAPGTCGEIPRFDRNQFGGTFGGPLRKDKTFFFLAYEGLRRRQATTREATVPSMVQWQTANGLAQELFGCSHPPPTRPGARPARMCSISIRRPTLAPIWWTRISSFPLRSSTRPGTCSRPRWTSMPVPSIPCRCITRWWTTTRFSPFDLVNAFTSLPGYGTFTHGHGQNAGLEWTRVFRSKLVNEFRLGFIRMRFNELQQNHGEDISAQLGFPDVLTNPVDLGAPDINLIGFDGIGAPVNYPQDRHDTTLQLSDNVAWTVGRNQFKIGTDIRRVRIDDYLDFLARGDWFFLGQTVAGIFGAEGDPTPCTGAPPDDPADLFSGAVAGRRSGLRPGGERQHLQQHTQPRRQCLRAG